MATELYMRRRLGGLFPTDAMSEEALEALPEDKTVKAVVTMPRNVEHHRKFFALLAAVFPHQDQWPTLDALLVGVKVALGYGETVFLNNGRVVLVPGSISFAKMDQRAFEEFYERAVKLVLTKIVPNVGREDLEAQVFDILAGRAA